MYEAIKRLGRKIPKKPLGILFIILGFLALVTPLTPGSWLIFVGLELLGVRYAFKDQLQKWLHISKAQDEEKRQSDRSD